MRSLQRKLDAGLDEFKWFIYRFNSPVMKSMFARPRNVLRIEEAVIGMLAGDVFDSRAVRVRLRLFRVLYALTALGMWSNAWRHRRHARREAALPFGDDTLAAGGP